MNFVEERVSLLDGERAPVTVKAAINPDGYRSVVESDLDRIAKANGFIAWVREAIKAKERMIQKIVDTSIEDWCEQVKGYKYPEMDEHRIINDELKNSFRDEDSYFAEMNVKELNRYLCLDAEAAVIGKVIHKHGALRLALDRILDAESNPTTVYGTGHDTVVTERASVCPREDVQDFIVELQHRHREVEAQINKIKYDIKQKVEANNRNARDVAASRRRQLAERMQVLTLEYQNWISEQTENIGNLKIVIPDELKDFVDGLQKKK